MVFTGLPFLACSSNCVVFDCVDTSELSGVARLDSGMRVCLITKGSEMISMFGRVGELNHSEQ